MGCRLLVLEEGILTTTAEFTLAQFTKWMPSALFTNLPSINSSAMGLAKVYATIDPSEKRFAMSMLQMLVEKANDFPCGRLPNFDRKR